ncbi:hypothetical protein [Alicyclobacillus shizuokensis]|uniref:hypothetical protein n=1 Tax=Alicyclobacillus shizuokensis TaxID=392014 RepID=UPI00082A8D68|nr:hypothetical protein [Alicyclobacillus shizuokensis]
MASVSMKGLGAMAVLAVTWVNHTLSPLFWVLLALVAVDLLLNLHQEAKQLQKLGSAFFALGIPTFISDNAGQILNPEILKALVCLLCLGYVWVLTPQVLAWLSKVVPKAEQPALSSLEQQAVEAIVQKAVAQLRASDAQAAQGAEPTVQQIEQSAQEAAIGPETPAQKG